MSRNPSNNENSKDPFFDPEAEDSQATESMGGADFADTAAADYAALKADRDSLFDRLARATAEFKNSQRRLQQDLEQQRPYANGSLIKSLLPVIDNFERALSIDTAKADTASVLKGLQIVHDQLMSVLRQQHVEEIAPPAGTPFDPAQHEALMEQDSIYKTPTVVQLMQKGYALHGRTLRPAQVAVSKSS